MSINLRIKEKEDFNGKLPSRLLERDSKNVIIIKTFPDYKPYLLQYIKEGKKQVKNDMFKAEEWWYVKC
jgi:hypothetical protein